MRERVTVVTLSVSHILDFEDGVFFTFQNGHQHIEQLESLECGAF